MVVRFHKITDFDSNKVGWNTYYYFTKLSLLIINEVRLNIRVGDIKSYLKLIFLLLLFENSLFYLKI